MGEIKTKLMTETVESEEDRKKRLDKERKEKEVKEKFNPLQYTTTIS
jgi:hypothetical protein